MRKIRRNWTLNSDLGLTDGNPNPIHWFANVSLVGNSPIRSRENDTIGIGYYHLGVSNLPILTIHGIGAENGVELFYNAAVTPWFHVTPDLQILDPAQQPHPDGHPRRHQGQAVVLTSRSAAISHGPFLSSTRIEDASRETTPHRFSECAESRNCRNLRKMPIGSPAIYDLQ